MRRTNRRLLAVALVVGSGGLVAAVAAAHGAPARGYELSLYASTPTATWAGLAAAAVAGVIAAFAAPRSGRLRDAGLVLIGSAAVAVTAMPVLRGYRFYGAGDSLSHLGWAREIAAGSLSPTELLYPGIHTTTAVVAAVTGVPPSLAMQYVTSLLFPLVFLLSVPLIVRLATGARRAYAIGLAAAALFVPVNNVSVHPTAHPASQGILFASAGVLLALTYVFDPSASPDDAPSAVADTAGSTTIADGSGRIGVSGVGVVLGVISAAVVLIHPQQALNLTLVFAAVAGLQLVYWRLDGDHSIASHRWLGPQTALIAALFLLWAPRFERVRGALTFTIGNLLGGDTSTGDVVAAKTGSLTAVGASVSTVFLKLFLAGAVLSVVAGAVLFAAASGRFRDEWTDASVRYLGAALVPMAAVFAVVFAAGAGDMYFRYQGFIMVFVTVLGAVGLALGVDRLDGLAARGAGRVAAVVLLLALAPVAAVGYHPSPYMYQPTPHVSDGQIGGYESAFDHRQAGVAFVGIRGGPRRFVDYRYGTERARTDLEFPGYRAGVPPSVFAAGNYSQRYDEPRYLAVTRLTYERETRLYGGLRYADAGFDRLGASPSVDRIRSSSEFRLYLLADDAEEPDGDEGGG